MTSGTTTLDKELQTLFATLCDGLRQEVRARWLARSMVPIKPIRYEVSLTKVREREVASCLYFQLRSTGYFVQPESYWADYDEEYTPDFRIWLPQSRQFLFLEFKLVAWGGGSASHFAGIWKDLRKLFMVGANPVNLPNGLLVVGFSKPAEDPTRSLETQYNKLSQRLSRYPGWQLYQQIGLKKIEQLAFMDAYTHYAMVGLWVRKPSDNPGKVDDPAHPEPVEGNERA